MTATPRVGLVLGAGGVAGGAFHAGVLAALHEATGWDPRHAGVLVGTSAGSIAAASLRAGLSCADMLARAQDLPLAPIAGRRHCGSLPVVARPRSWPQPSAELLPGPSRRHRGRCSPACCQKAR